MRQLEHSEVKNLITKFPISLYLDELKTSENIGMMCRSAAIMGISTIYLTRDTFSRLNWKKIKKISRGALKHVSIKEVIDGVQFLENAKKEKTLLVGLEITDKSVPIYDFEFTKQADTILVIGSEVSGISEEILSILDFSVFIPMFGPISSMNVANSTAIALYEISKQFTSVK